MKGRAVKLFTVTERDIKNIVSRSLMDEESKEHFLNLAAGCHDSLTNYTYGVLTNYADNYQSLVDAPLSVEEYNSIYQRFERLDAFLSSGDTYDGLDVRLVYPMDTAVSYACEISDGFSSFLYDDMYNLMSGIEEAEISGTEYDTGEEEDKEYVLANDRIVDRLETVTDMTKYIVSEIESIVLPMRQPEVGVPVFFTMKENNLLIFLG